MARIAARSSAPSAPATASPNSARIAGIAAPPGAVRAWAMASVSTTEHAARGEQVGNGALAAADAAGEPDNIRHGPHSPSVASA
jgi:hypothetical protein